MVKSNARTNLVEPSPETIVVGFSRLRGVIRYGKRERSAEVGYLMDTEWEKMPPKIAP